MGDYWQLLKPRIMLLIVITTIGSLALAADVEEPGPVGRQQLVPSRTG